MSYKTKLQTNNDNLEGNNIDLQSILNTINELPAVGSGEGVDTSDATITEADVLSGKIAYGANGKIIGAIPMQGATTITPTSEQQTAIAAKTYVLGSVIVAGDTNLKNYNIRSGVRIFGTSGSYTSDATAISADIAEGKIAYVKGQKIIGTHTCGGIDTSDATATAENILNGKTAYGANGKITGTMPSQIAKYITPTTTSQTAIAAGTYAIGAVTVAGDADLVASNIKKGVSIFGVDGSYEATGGIDTSDATATAADIAPGKTAYVNGEKVTGSMIVQSYYVSNVAPSSTLGNDGDLCLVRAGE